IQAYLRPDRNTSAFQGRLTPTSNMFNNETGGMPAQPVKVALNRWTDPSGNVLVQGLVDKGSGWAVVGSAWARDNKPWAGAGIPDDVYVGFAATGHQNDGRLETILYRNAEILPAQAPTGPLPRLRGAVVNVPESLVPDMGVWSVVEVINNGDMNSVNDAVSSLQSGNGTRHAYTLAGPININDHRGNAKYFGGDRGYGVREDGIVSGEVNHIAFLARGTIRVPEAGEYSFYINGDDGEELSIGNRDLVLGSEGWNDNNIGTIYLEAGDHPIQVVHREATGGADLEVAAAKGRTTNLKAFNLIGANAPARAAYDVIIPGYHGQVTVEATAPGSYRPGSRDAAIQAILDGRSAGTNSVGTADKVHAADPQNGGSYFANPLPFPNDTAADDNDFAFMATGKLVIPVDGTYYIGYDSDDGAALQIMGAVWQSIVENRTGNAVIAGDWLKTDAWTGHSYTVGQVALAAGTYDFNFYAYEGGGGAHASIFGSSERGNYFILGQGAQSINIPAAAPSLALVPEPASLSLLAIGGLSLLARRRRA
ncbi:MAG TPA: PA14 domain-containing protein, partial [Candidatus Omnitrophota bacterium]|nr:PA14 domain-containing protein [Candidatus Omnitrophota bacterium]